MVADPTLKLAIVEALSKALLTDPVPANRSYAARALAQQGEAAIPSLCKALNQEQNSAVRNRIIRILGTLKPVAVPKRLEAPLLDKPFIEMETSINTTKINTKRQNKIAESAKTMHILHLSDLHFGTSENAQLWYSQLAEDLHQELQCSQLDALILSGDITNRATTEEYEAARQFLYDLCLEFQLKPKQLVIVPGNHDLHWPTAEDAYIPVRRRDYQGKADESTVIDTGGSYIEVKNPQQYQQRFAHFSQFYQAVSRQPYDLDPAQQYTLHPFPEHKLLVLGLNSAWQLDHHYRSRAAINPLALSNALNAINQIGGYQDWLKLAVWHHPLHSPGEDRITDGGFMERLAVNGFRFALHGHIHTARTELYRYDQNIKGRKIDLICAGTFGASTQELVPGYPWQYNLLRLQEQELIVETRCREEENRAWKPDSRWLSELGSDPQPRYRIRYRE